MKAELIPETWRRLVSPETRKKLGIFTAEEQMAKWKAKNERDLQRQIVAYLRQRDIEVIWHATHRKSTATKGTPDILFAVMVHGLPMAVGMEVKFGSGTLEREQNDMHMRMKTRPNAWRVVVIRNFIEVVDLMRELGL